ncbi:MAG: hypothetical protein NUV67_06085 [archaeon]|nr:hypothetical protein [archaeon]
MGTLGKIFWTIFDIIVFLIFIPIVILKFIWRWLKWRKNKPVEIEAEFEVEE